MICNKCGKPMIQYQEKGGGGMTEDYYDTWEIKYCKECDDYVLEEYSATRIMKEDIEKYCNTYKYGQNGANKSKSHKKT